MAQKEVSKPRMVANIAIMAGIVFLIPSLGNIGSDEAAGKLDEKCEPFVGYVVASWVTPTSFWQKQVDHYSAALNVPFKGPSVDAAKQSQMVAHAASNETAMFQQIRSEQPPRDPLLAQADALRSAADTVEIERNLQLANQLAYQQYAQDRAHSETCLTKAKSHL